MSAIKEIKRFATDRDINKMQFHQDNYSANVVEELLELIMINVPREQRPELKRRWGKFRKTWERDFFEIPEEPVTLEMIEHEQIDAMADVIVFSMTEIMKKGYDPELVLQETAKEINSRTGTMIDGKFEKDLSKEAKAKWYKADYTNCKM